MMKYDNKDVTLSVLIKVYNHEKYISKCIESVLNQTVNFDYEIIIGDDCSTDNSRKVIQSYADAFNNIVPIFRDENIGGTNNGIDITLRAKGKYICIIDGDDFFLDRYKLQRQFDYLESHSELYSVASRKKIVDENNRILPYKHYKNNSMITSKNINKLKDMPLIGSFMFRNVFLNNNFEQERFKKICSMHSTIDDWSWLLFFLDKSSVVVFHDYFVCYRHVLSYSASNFNSLYRLKKNRYDVVLEKKNYEQLLNEFDFKELKINYKVAKKAGELWLQMLLDRNKESRQYGKAIYKEEFVPQMTILERFTIPIRVVFEVASHIVVKIKQYVYKIESKNEIEKEV